MIKLPISCLWVARLMQTTCLRLIRPPSQMTAISGTTVRPYDGIHSVMQDTVTKYEG